MAEEALTKEQKVARYRRMNADAPKGAVLFAGSSLMEMFPVTELAEEDGLPVAVLNRGIGGFITDELLENLDTCILALRPRKLFINIGTNDLSMRDRDIPGIMDNYARIIRAVRAEVPDVRVYMMAYYPVNYEAADERAKAWISLRNNDRVNEANRAVRALAKELGAVYIDVNAPLRDERGRLRAGYTIEGVHIKEEGYRAIWPLVKPYILEDV